MRKTLLLTVGCLLGIWTFCYAQNNPIIPDYLSSGGVGNNLNTGTPQVWSLLKYGGSAPNLYTGTVSASIPLYTYQDEDFTLPVVLNYASNGYMPNIQASDVGLGWFLNTGGVITRTVRGVPDDYMSAGLWGYFFNNQDFTNESWNLWANYINGQDKEMYSIKSGSMSVETEPDIYTFSFPGHYGKFISTGGKIHVFDTDDPHGEYSVEIYDPLVTSKVITIVTGDGYRYKFLAKNEKAFVAEPNADGSGLVWTEIGHLSPKTRAADEEDGSAKLPENWYLSSITAPNGRVVTFDYGNDLETIRYVENCRVGGAFIGYRGVEEPAVFHYKERAVQLKSIDIDGLAKVRFAYGDRRAELKSDETALDTPEKLDTIVITKWSDEHSKFVTLRKCYLQYTYGIGNPVLLLSSVRIPGQGTYSMEYYRQDEPFPFQGTASIDFWGYYNREATYAPFDLRFPLLNDSCYNFTERIADPAGPRKPGPEYARQGMLSKLTYPTGGYTTYQYEPHMFRDYLVRDRSSQNIPYLKRYAKDTIAGGLRIRRITDHPITGDSIGRTYFYLNDGEQSSGNLLNNPVAYYVIGKIGSETRYGYNYSGIAGYRTDQSHVEYAAVREEADDGSAVYFQFSNYHNAPDSYRINKKTLKHPNIDVLKYLVDGSDKMVKHEDLPMLVNNFLTEPDFEPQYRGKLLSVSYYDKPDVPGNKFLRKKVEYAYLTDTTEFRRKYVESVKFAGDYFYVQRSYLEPYPLDHVTETEYFKTGGATVQSRKQYAYTYNALGQIKSVRRTESDGTGMFERTQYVSDLSSTEQNSGVYATMIAKNVLNLPLKVWKTVTDGKTDPNRPGFGETELRIAEDQYEYMAVANKIIRVKMHKVARIGAPQAISTQPVCDTVTVYQYDDMGRLVQTTDRAGLKVSYVWGYRGLYPVAQVVGADYATVKQKIVSSLPLTEGLDTSREAALRSIPNTLVTTYEYNPQVGVCKVTDPSGRYKRFSYDSFGRLVTETHMEFPVFSYEYSVANR